LSLSFEHKKKTNKPPPPIPLFNTPFQYPFSIQNNTGVHTSQAATKYTYSHAINNCPHRLHHDSSC
jgi:hypothetical protein